MVLYSSFESVLRKHPDVRCVGRVFQPVIPQIQGEKEEKKTKRIPVPCQLVSTGMLCMLLVKFVTSESDLVKFRIRKVPSI